MRPPRAVLRHSLWLQMARFTLQTAWNAVATGTVSRASDFWKGGLPLVQTRESYWPTVTISQKKHRTKASLLATCYASHFTMHKIHPILSRTSARNTCTRKHIWKTLPLIERDCCPSIRSENSPAEVLSLFELALSEPPLPP